LCRAVYLAYIYQNDCILERVTRLLKLSESQLVEAVIVNLSAKHLDDFTVLWKPRLQKLVQDDSCWNWVEKERRYVKWSNYEKYAIECEQITQGLMIIEIDWHRSQFFPHKRLVYIESLATAPWNRATLPNQQFRGVGSALLNFARERSYELGYGGFVGLHSLPSAEAFYSRLKLANLGADPDKDDLVYFEWVGNQDN
jgi:GNAT superfamily N-acetyltransferase